MPAPVEIIQLVELFERNYDQYRNPTFTEAAVRHQFITAPSTSPTPPTSRGTTAWSRWSRMLDLHKRLAAEGVPHEKTALQRQIEMTDRQIEADGGVRAIRADGGGDCGGGGGGVICL